VDGGEGLAVGADEAVVDGDKFHFCRPRFGDDGAAELGVGCADDETLGAGGGEAVNGGEDLFAVGGADLNEREAELAGGLLGEAPLELEPGLLGLLDEEADLDRCAGGGGAGDETRGADGGDGGAEKTAARKRGVDVHGGAGAG